MTDLQLELFPVSANEWATADEGYLQAVAVAVLGPVQAEELLAHLTCLCVDCGMDTLAAGETFMANNDLWATAGAGREFLCVECFELRLGRHLTPGDFRPEVPINWQGPLGQTELSDGRADVSELGRALIDAKAAGELLNVPTSWVLAEARANRIPHVRLGRYVRFDAEELLEWCKSQHRGPGQGR